VVQWLTYLSLKGKYQIIPCNVPSRTVAEPFDIVLQQLNKPILNGLQGLKPQLTELSLWTSARTNQSRSVEPLRTLCPAPSSSSRCVPAAVVLRSSKCQCKLMTKRWRLRICISCSRFESVINRMLLSVSAVQPHAGISGRRLE
jgi:hypothetical protein